MKTSKELFESILEHSAYDYEAQVWVKGLDALRLKINQLTEKTNVLFGKDGQKYADMIRVDLVSYRKTVQGMLYVMENELAGYEATLRRENLLNP